MKYAVGIFYRIKNYLLEKIDLLKTVVPIIVSMSFIVILGALVIKKDYGIKSIMVLATNVRQAEKHSYSITNLVKAYPVFNGNNYVLAEVEVPESNENIQDVAKKQEFDVTAVDVVSKFVLIDKPDLIIKETNNYTRVDIHGVTIYDYSTREINYEDLFNMNINLTKKSDPILLYCTHTSETYTNSENYEFQYSGNYRSRDGQYNMLSVASVISKSLNDKNFTTILDTTPHDYTSYQNAYTNAKKTLELNLEKYSRFGIAIDVHRDAIADLSFAPKVNINNKSVAQLMLVVGVGTDGYENEYWKQNLSLALQIVRVGESMYPGLFRHVLVRDSRYNQHLNNSSLLVEVGATGNTLEEAYYGARCFANILQKIYK